MKFTPEEVQLLVTNKIIPPNTPPAQIEFFATVCEKKKLDPFLKQIHLVQRNEKVDNKWVKSYSIQAGLDGMRAIAQRNVTIKKYERGVAYKQGLDATQNRLVDKLYGWCKIITDTGEYYDEAPFVEYVQRRNDGNWNHFWKKFPETMIKKVAEESVLRMVAPEDLSEIRGETEMGTIEGETITTIDGINSTGDKGVIKKHIKELQQKDIEEAKTEEVDAVSVMQEGLNSEAVEVFKPEQSTMTVNTPEGKKVTTPLPQEKKKTEDNKYLSEDDFKKRFRQCKTYGQFLTVWNKLSRNQKANKEEEFLNKMIDVCINVEQLSNLITGCSQEMKQKFHEKFADKRNQFEGKVQEDMFNQVSEEEVMKELDQFKTKKELKNWGKKNLTESRNLNQLHIKE